MIQKEFTILNETGLHVRPAGKLAKLTKDFNCTIKFQYNTQEYDAKSVLSIMAACVKYNSVVTFITNGPDEEKAMDAIVAAVKNRFGEEK